jgi:hypothetical protein
MLSTNLNPGANWLILSVCSTASHHAYKFIIHHWQFSASAWQPHIMLTISLCIIDNSQCLLDSLTSCLQIQCASLMTHLKSYHNSTPSVSVNNWCRFYYTSYRSYSEYPLTQGHTFSSNSSWGLLCLIDILNYFSVIYACNT